MYLAFILLTFETLCQRILYLFHLSTVSRVILTNALHICVTVIDYVSTW